MKRTYHFTSNKKWKMIQDSGLLLPESRPFQSKIEVPDHLKQIVTADKYLCGILEPSNEVWAEYGIMEKLIQLTTGKVTLDVPILKREDAFVRDLALISPKRFIDLYGKDFWSDPEVGPNATGEKALDYQKAMEAWWEYIESSTPLERYNRTFKAPEIWLNQITLIELIKKVE